MHLAHLKAPDLWPPIGMSKDVENEIKMLNAVVIALRYHVEGFAAALELYRFGQSRPANVDRLLARDWQWIAIHEAAMRIWFLRDAMDIARRKWIRECVEVAKYADDAAMESALRLFDTHFPDFRKMRNAIAHAPGIESSNLRAWLKDDVFAASKLNDDDRFELVNDGVQYSMHMTTETLDKLSEILLAFWVAFKPVEIAFDQRGRSEG